MCIKTMADRTNIGVFVTILLSQFLSCRGIHEFHILAFPILFYFYNFLFVMLCFLFMNFLSPFCFSLYKTDALIFRHKAVLLDEDGDEKEKTAGILTCFTGLLRTVKVSFGLPPGKGGLGQGLLTV